MHQSFATRIAEMLIYHSTKSYTMGTLFMSPWLRCQPPRESFIIFRTPEPKAQGELIVLDLSLRPSTLSNMNISETSWPIIIKFHQEHHWGGGLTALGFW